MSTKLKSSGYLLLAAIIWGFGFVAQRFGMEHIGPFLFCALRLMLAAATIYFVISFREKRIAALVPLDGNKWRDPTVRGGIYCGIALFTAGGLQQIGLVFTSASKGGFLTALYIVMVPLLGLFLRHRVHWNTWLAVLLAVPGLYLLCVTESFEISVGDVIVITGAVFWAVHILATDYFVDKVDVFRMCTIQFITAAVLSVIAFFLIDPFFVEQNISVMLAEVWAAMPAIAFAGILASGVAFTAQALGQRDAPPAVAALIMSTEAVFATIGGFLILHESFTIREAVGCVLMFVAVLLAQIPMGNHSNSATMVSTRESSVSD